MGFGGFGSPPVASATLSHRRGAEAFLPFFIVELIMGFIHTFCCFFKFFVPAIHQRLLLFPAPSLYLLFAVERKIDAVIFLIIDKLYGKPLFGMVGAFPSLMLGEPQFKVLGAAGIVAAVGAQEYVHPSFHGWSFLVVKNSDFRERMVVASALNKKKSPPLRVEIRIQSAYLAIPESGHRDRHCWRPRSLPCYGNRPRPAPVFLHSNPAA